MRYVYDAEQVRVILSEYLTGGDTESIPVEPGMPRAKNVSPHRSTEAATARADVSKAWHRVDLSQMEREVVAARIAGFTFREIAAACNVAASSAWAMEDSALTELTNYLNGE